MANIDEIIDALRTNRTEFGRIFLTAQSDLPLAERTEFETLCRNISENKIAFKTALLHAEQMKFLSRFLELAATNLENGNISKAIIQALSQNGNNLQAMVNPNGFQLPEQHASGILNGIKWTGKVLIEGKAAGTGVLIGPSLFLTAWHVVSVLFDKTYSSDGTEIYNPKKYTNTKPCPLVIEFDNNIKIVNGNMVLGESKRVDAHFEWYVCHSCCHPQEFTNQLPNNRNELSGYWDYVVIKLAKPFGFERRWARLNTKAVVPPDNGNIILFQYPAGQDLKIDWDCIKPSTIPGIRFLHKANGVHGSSGGPCFDREFTLIGIHQGAWPEDPTENKMNRGIPITSILEHISSEIKKLPLFNPDDTQIWSLDNTRLVFGCDDFISAIWDMVTQENRRLLMIKGGEKTGKTFLIEVLKTFLLDADHLKIIVDAGLISKEQPIEIAKRLCTTAGATIPDFTTLEDFNSSTAAWLKDEVVFKTLEAINNVRNGRLTWICITDLNKFDFEVKSSSDFFYAFYEELRSNSGIRIILDGMKVLPPRSVRDLADTFDLKLITDADVLVCAKRMKIALGRNEDLISEIQAKALISEYTQKMHDQPMTALTNLLEKCRQVFYESITKN